MKKTIKITNELYVISDEMREAYHRIFQIDSFVIRNYSVERKLGIPVTKNMDFEDCLIMVYAGGLHYNRWKVLALIANMLADINSSNSIKCFLKIYSSQNISDDIIETLNVEGASAFCGRASAVQVSEVYAHSDILLHVESFDKNAIASTKYSFSTKIPEYLSADKCVLAVGPQEVASLRYLRNMACVVSDCSTLREKLKTLINDEKYRERVRKKCKKYYEKDFSARKQGECLRRIFQTTNGVPEWIN